uniref:Uncharacterized protein n=1 Tax=Arundo donax TaxID=35708 RepID=A0A0A8YDR1_ARUDO
MMDVVCMFPCFFKQFLQKKCFINCANGIRYGCLGGCHEIYVYTRLCA